MPIIHRKSRAAGLAPGTLVHIGEKKIEPPLVTVWQYDEHEFRQVEFAALDECLRVPAPGVTWINVAGLHETPILHKIGECFGLHPLALEDILDTTQRPKLEDYGDYLLVVLKALHPGPQTNQADAEQVSIILGPTYVISFEERQSEILHRVRERIRDAKGRIRKGGADYLAYAIIDAVVDNYFAVIEALGDRLGEVEDELLTRAAPDAATTIHRLRKETMFLRRILWPLREVVSGLQRSESPLVQPATAAYLRDIYDHVIEVIDTLETYRDLAAGMLEIYLTRISTRLNEIMKVLTIIATIFIPLTFITGIYGMNFRFMPELGWRWGYPAALLVMAALGSGMLLYFRRKRWL